MKIVLSTTILAVAIAATGCGRSSGHHVNAANTVAAPARSIAITPKLKVAIPAIIDKDSVGFEFELSGATDLISKVDLVTFQCKLGEDVAFRDCSAKPFTVDKLEDTKSYNMTVIANLTDKASKETLVSEELIVNFAVDLPGGAAVDPAAVVANTDGSDPVNTSGKVTALSRKVQLGTSYVVQVPENLHITEYWNQLSYGGSTSFRIVSDSDPNYFGLSAADCSGPGLKLVEIVNPSGKWYQYCKKQMQESAFRNEYQGTEAYVEVATDHDLVSESNHERLFLSTYDNTSGYFSRYNRYQYLRNSQGASIEVPRGLKKFAQLCQGKNIEFIDVPMINNFVIGRSSEEVRFWYCDSILPDAQGEPTAWMIGGFIERDNRDVRCSDCDASARTIEAIYMVRPSGFSHMPAYFARNAQERIGSTLRKIMP
jgi:hypothetical protein